MKYILCYGDSNTWGCVPETFERYDFSVRWPGVMQRALGAEYHVYENALNGRTTVFEDPIEEGRNGRTGFEGVLMQNAPLDAMILMLGVNDCKIRFSKQPWDIAWGLDLLLQIIEKERPGRDGRVPEIIVVPPVPIGGNWGSSLHGTVFDDESRKKSVALSALYRRIAERHHCTFFDPAAYAAAGADGIHLAPDDHLRLGRALAGTVKDLFE